jgi:hypothetical protein
MIVIEVFDRKTGEVVDTVECRHCDPDRVERGMLINMDRSRFLTRHRIQEEKR